MWRFSGRKCSDFKGFVCSKNNIELNYYVYIYSFNRRSKKGNEDFVRWRAFKKFLEDSNFPDMRIHDLRHSYATLMLDKGVEMKITSQVLGHSSVNITADLYSHMLIGMQERAVEIVDEVFK